MLIDYLKKGRTVNSQYYIALVVRLKEEIAKNGHKWSRKKYSFTRQCSMSQVDCNDSKTTWNALWISSTPNLFSRLEPEQLLAVCRPRKNVPGKELWLQWRTGIENWGVYWGQKQIVHQKRHWTVREALKSVNHPRIRLCW